MDIKELEHRFTKGEEKINENTRRIDELEKRQDNLDELVGTVKVLADREERVEGDVKEIKDDVKSLTAKPGKRMDELWKIIATAIISTILGFVLSKIGLSF